MRNSDEESQGSSTGLSASLESWQHHGETSNTQRQYGCVAPGCNRLFTSKFKLMRHMLIHGGERRFECPSCERRFHRKDHLKTHLQIHNPNKALHSCDLCGKKYSSALSFRKHTALHAAESGDPVCRLCGEVFSHREEVMLHLKVHSGSRALKGPTERKFKCESCDRSFFTRKDVKRHMVVHTGQRNFVCQFCPQKFGRKDHLVRHTKKSHGSLTVMSDQSPPGSSSVSEPSPVGLSLPILGIKQEKQEVGVGLALAEETPLMQESSSCPPLPTTPVMEAQPGVIPDVVNEPAKQEAWSTFLSSSLVEEDNRIKQEVGQNFVPPYFSIVPHFLPNNQYMWGVSSTTPISLPSSVDLASPLPHFSQAFQ